MSQLPAAAAMPRDEAAEGVATVASRAPVTARESDARAARSQRRNATTTRWTALVAVALLALYAGMAWTGSLGKGVSFDEGVQLAVGYDQWLHGDFRIEGANGDLIKRWSTLPFLFSRPRFLSTSDPLWQHADSYEFGRKFLFELGNAPEWLLAQARAMVALLGIATGWLVFRATRELFGDEGGLIALAWFVFSPHMLAFGGIVSTDMSTVLTLFGSTYWIWQLLHEFTVARLAASLGCFALLLLAKMTAVVIFPVAALLVTVRFVGRRPWLIRWRDREITVRRRSAQAAVVAILVLLHAVVGYTAIWAQYDFRYLATPPTAGSSALAPQPYADGHPGLSAVVVRFAQEHRLLPEGYCRGVVWLLGTDDNLPAFMRGEAKLGGWRAFFPYAIWVKTQPALLILIAVGLTTWWRRHREHLRSTVASRVTIIPPLYSAAPFAVLIATYLAIAVGENINLGHRHVLPIYPAMYVLAGSIVLIWRRDARV